MNMLSKTMTFLLAFALILSLIAMSTATAAITVPQMVTNADVNALDSGAVVTGPPLTNIDTMSGSEANGGIFTNQSTGSVATSGDVLTIAGLAINSMIDGGAFSSVKGPNGNPLFLVSVVKGTLQGGPQVKFTAGNLTFYEANAAFDARVPSTWLGGTLLGSATLVNPPVSVSPSAFGLGAPIGGGVAAAQMNLSFIDTSLSGGGLGNFLFEEDSNSTFLFNYDVNLVDQVDQGGLFAEVDQKVDGSATGLTIPGVGAMTLQSQAALDSFAAGAGFGSFASGVPAYGGSAVVSPNYTMDPNGLGLGTGTGDFFASFSADIYPTVDNVIPEPVSLLVWAGLLAIAAGYGVRRRRA